MDMEIGTTLGQFHLLALFKIFLSPLFTKHSQLLGKLMLKISILSVRKYMGGLQPIHILYMGEKDTEFKAWLRVQNVVVHAHEPKWTDMIERLRLAGDPNSSHLFAHAGNYIGTWQRIDIPNLIESEYILYLDADTVVTKAFTMADFGPQITSTVAFALEAEHKPDIPLNAGVALMNVPNLRVTRNEFLKFIEGRETQPFSGPSDQGAYLDFYHPELLDRTFNIKSYYIDIKGRKIIHFHGPKPFELFKYMIGKNISPLMTGILAQGNGMKSPCTALIAFSQIASTESGLILQYCTAAFPRDANLRLLCINFLDQLPSLSPNECKYIGKAIHFRESFRSLHGKFFVGVLLCAGLLCLKFPKRGRKAWLALKVKASKMLSKCGRGKNKRRKL